jgi:hypothetical protein
VAQYGHISGWVGHCSVCCGAQYVVCQSVIVTLLTDICKRSLENHILDLDVNGNVLLDIGINEVVRQVMVYTELMWGVFGCFGVVL